MKVKTKHTVTYRVEVQQSGYILIDAFHVCGRP